jgi:propanol-preferring alcohol dehydrogenase
VELRLADPPAGHVRIRVEACGICGSDALTVEGIFPGVTYPRVPGHEVIGTVDAIGTGVEQWHVGQRVGIGFLGGHCEICSRCRRGDFVNCERQPISGVHTDGGYAEVMIARANALAAIPEELSPIEAAPLLCAGLTTFNALRNTAQDPATELRQWGGAQAILATAANNKAMSALVDGLAPRGEMVVAGVGGDEPISVHAGHLVLGQRSIVGTLTGRSIDNEDTLAFSALQSIRAMVETFPLARAPEAYQRMMENAARFRIVLVTASGDLAMRD